MEDILKDDVLSYCLTNVSLMSHTAQRSRGKLKMTHLWKVGPALQIKIIYTHYGDTKKLKLESTWEDKVLAERFVDGVYRISSKTLALLPLAREDSLFVFDLIIARSMSEVKFCNDKPE